MIGFPISSVVTGRLNQLQIELVGLLIGLGLLELQQLLHPRLLKGFGLLVIFTNLNLRNVRSDIWPYFVFFSIINGFKWFQMAGLYKNVRFIQVFTTLFLLSLRTFLMMLSVLWLSVLMKLLSTPSVIRHLICCSKESQLLNLNLIYEALDWGRKWLAEFNPGKSQLLSFDRSNDTYPIDLIMDELFLRKNHLLRC